MVWLCMSYKKLSITLEPEIAEELRQVAGPRGVSAFVNDALRQRLQAVRVSTLLDEMDAEAGPVPEDVQQRIDELPWPD